MNKILFLDIDGVMNYAAADYRLSLYPIREDKVALLHKIVKETGCEIVLSSAWRHNEEAIEEINRKIAPIKLLGTTPRYVSETKYKGQELCRGHNIQDWLDNHPEVEQYAIVDDSAKMLESQMSNFFKTDPQYGMTEEVTQQIIKSLNNQSNGKSN